MVLPRCCCPLTSTRCHRSKDEGEKKSKGKKTSCSTSSRCFLSSAYKHRYVQAHPSNSPSTNTLLYTAEHTHSNAHSPLLSNPDSLDPIRSQCLLTKLISFCQANQFLLSTDLHWTAFCRNTAKWKYIFFRTAQMNRYATVKWMFGGSSGGEKIEGGGWHTGKQLEIKDEAGWGESCFVGKEQSCHYLWYRRQRKKWEPAADDSPSAPVGLFKGVKINWWISS